MNRFMSLCALAVAAVFSAVAADDAQIEKKISE